MKIRITTGKTCIEYEQQVDSKSWAAITDPSTGMGGVGEKPKMREVLMDHIERLCNKASEIEKSRIEGDIHYE